MSLNYATLLQRYFKMNEDHLADTLKGFASQEKEIKITENYYDQIQGGEIDHAIRKKLVIWMIEICNDLKVGYIAKQRSIILLDIVLSKLKIHKHYLQLLAITIILMMIKFEESFIFTLEHACDACENAYSPEEVGSMEMIILQALKWKLVYPTPGELVRNLLYLLDPTITENQGAVYREIDYLIEMCLIDMEPGYFSPSCVAITCLLKTVEPQGMDPNYFVETIGKFFIFENKKIEYIFHYLTKRLSQKSPQGSNEKSDNQKSLQETPETKASNDSMPESPLSTANTETGLDIENSACGLQTEEDKADCGQYVEREIEFALFEGNKAVTCGGLDEERTFN